MSTLREDFEAFAISEMLCDGITNREKTLMLRAWNAATERAAKVVEQVGPQDGSLALVTTGFAAAIRSGGEAGS